MRTKLFIITCLIAYLLLRFIDQEGYKVVIQSPVRLEPKELLSPVPEGELVKNATHGAQLRIQTIREVEAKTPEATPTPVSNSIEGEASYYSREGCIGCSENMIMANGQPLDDGALTLALTPEMVRQHKLLNDYVTVENLANGQTVQAMVTDTGGFARHGRVADLTIATRDAVGCKNLCQVKITY